MMNDADGLTGTEVQLRLFSGVYGWTVTATDSAGNAYTSATWYFEDDAEDDNAPPDVTVTAPNGGEEFEVQEETTITWYTLDDLTPTPDLKIRIFFSPDAGHNFQQIAELNDNPGAFKWIVPNQPTTLGLIKVTATDMGIPDDSSSSGSNTNSTGNATNGKAADVQLPATITTSNSSSSSSGDFVKTGQDVSDATFTIVEPENDENEDTNLVPEVDVTSPNGGEELKGGEPFGVTWFALDQDLTSTPELKVKVFFSPDAGEHFEQIAEFDHNPSAFKWQVPNIDTTLGLIKVVVIDQKNEEDDEDDEKDKEGQDTSDATFTIVKHDEENDEEEDTNAPPEVDVTSPNGGEEIEGGSEFGVTWFALDQDLTSTTNLEIKVFFSPDAGENFEQIAEFNDNPGAFKWQVPNIDTTLGLIKVIAIDRKVQNPEDEDEEFHKYGMDTSDATFTIVKEDEENPEEEDTNLVPEVDVTSPNGGEEINGGTDFVVTWFALDQDLTSTTELAVKVFFAPDGKEFEQIAQFDHNPGSFLWQVPNIDTKLGIIKVIAIDNKVQNPEDEDAEFKKYGMDVSDASFTIVKEDTENPEEEDTNLPPKITLTAPNGEEGFQSGTSLQQTITGGTVFPITWSVDDEDLTSTPNLLISLFLSVDGGANFIPIVRNIPNEGAFAWQVPNINTDNGIIRIVAIDAKVQNPDDENNEFRKAGLDVTDNSFAITADPRLPLVTKLEVDNAAFNLVNIPQATGNDNVTKGSGTGTDIVDKKGLTTIVTRGLIGDSPLKVDDTGKTTSTVKLINSTADGKKDGIEIAEGTRMKTASGELLTSVNMNRVLANPTAPQGEQVLEAQDMTPNGATFDQPITVTLAFDPAKLPKGVKNTDLTMNFFDGTKWVRLDSLLDITANTLSAKVNHFTVFAILAPATSAPASAPLSLSILSGISTPVTGAPNVTSQPAPADQAATGQTPAVVPIQRLPRSHNRLLQPRQQARPPIRC